MPQKNVRVNISTDPTQLLVLAGKIHSKSDALADASPLKGLDDAPLFAPALARATAQDTAADDFAKKAETAMGARNADLPTFREGVRARRDALLGAYRSNPKKLTEFGFDVSDSPQDNGGSAPPANRSNTPGPARQGPRAAATREVTTPGGRGGVSVSAHGAAITVTPK